MSDATTEVTLQFTRITRARRPRYDVTVLLGTAVLHMDTFDLSSAEKRTKFIKQLRERAEAKDVSVDTAQIEADLLQQAQEDALRLSAGLPPDANEQHDRVIDHKGVLNAFGIVVLGERDDQSIECWSTNAQKSFRVKTPSNWRAAEILQSVGPKVADRLCIGDLPDANQYTATEVQHAVALAAAESKRVNPADILGQGVWTYRKALLIVDGATAYVYDDTNSRRVSKPRLGLKIVEFDSTKAWHGGIAQAVGSVNGASSRALLQELIRILDNWNWSHSWDARTAAALVAATFVQAIWSWRPLVSITGPSDSGKSTLLQDLLAHIFLPWALLADRSTEAGLRQAMGHDSVPVMIDEFDQYKQRQSVLELFRTASRGGKVLRGTADQTGQQFAVRHIPWFASIESGDIWGQDRNRFIRLELLQPENRGELVLPVADELIELGRQLAAAAVWAGSAAVALANAIRGTRIDDVHGRLVESFSVPAAMFAVLRYGREATRRQAERILRLMVEGRVTLQEQGEPDEFQLLRDLLAANVRVADPRNGGHPNCELSVEQLLLGERHSEELAAKGLRLVVRQQTQRALFVVPAVVRTQLLAGTRWSDSRIDQVLARFPGAERNQQRSGGSRPWGISIPWPGCLETLGGQDAEQDTENATE